MKKKLIALAVAGAFAPALALAQGNVTIYGTLNTSLDFTKAGGATAGGAADINSTNQVSCSSCNIGFKGTEDLGGGLKAWFQLESGINPDERGNIGTSTAAPTSSIVAGDTLTSRNSAVGLEGAFGKFGIGNWDTPHKNIINAKVPFHATTVAGYNSILGATGGQTGTTFDNRQRNSINYWSPTLGGGGQVRVMYSSRTDSTTATGVPGDANEDQAWGASFTWDAGPLFAGVGYERHNDARAVAGVSKDDTAWSVNVSYAFSGNRVGVLYENAEYENAANPTGTDRNAWGLFATLPVGAGEVHAQYLKANSYSGANPNTGARQFAIGYYHNLSKRTQVYGLYTKLDNDAAATYNLGAGPGLRLAAPAGADPQAFSLGVRHSF